MVVSNMEQSKMTKTKSFTQRNHFSTEELEKIINELLDKHFKVYNRLAEI